ncbi:MAG: hypothetical protein JXP34_20680 [Planctomycetes bacterium]|nr:hypothetical protein [Planctomycetota bacterium]
MPILNCGMACQSNSAELAPLDDLDPYIQDALDLVEFANGPATSPWGHKRAEMGHPEPFGLEFLGIGNEQWGPQYIERYERFAKVLKARHPEVLLISSAGPAPADERFDFAWKKLRGLGADIVDEHCYAGPDWFLDNAGRYDGRERAGPKVFMGEYAAQSVGVCSPENRNDWGCALAEAAFLTGLERNADLVVMSSYAPLSGHADGWQWKPNLIWFDNLRSYGTPSYYVQQLFARHRGDVVLPVAIEGQEPASSEKPGLYACASRVEKTGGIILKVVNSAKTPIRAAVRLRVAGALAAEGAEIVLAGASLADENSFDAPKKVAPVRSPFRVAGAEFAHTFRPWSVTVLRIGGRS